MIDSKKRAAASIHEHAPTEAIPLHERRGALTMGLLWTTMVTGFPTVLAGFDWYKQNFTFAQVLTCLLVSTAILLAYMLPACYLGAKTGLSYTGLSHRAFGRWGSWLVSFNIAWSSIAWYALTAVFLAQGLQGLFTLSISTWSLAAALAVAMAFNNFFGFEGVANFARYAAGPVLIVWIIECFGKVTITAAPLSHWWATTTTRSSWHALAAVSAFVIGYAVWGNEADYWRYGRPGLRRVAIPLSASLALGQIVFPLTGWMVASLTHTSDASIAAAVMNDYAFGHATTIAAAVLIATYVALNDSLLYATATALDNVRPMARRIRVAFLCLVGAGLAALFSQSSDSFAMVASLSSIVLPAATVIIMVDAFFPLPRKKLAAHSQADRPQIRKVGCPAILSLLAGCAVGIITSGIVPGIDPLGVPSLQSWLVSMVAYLVLRRHFR
jgi:purine-cytosine permease-like protein